MNELNLIIVPDPEDLDAAEIFVDGTIGDRKYRFLLDTGAAKSRVVFDDYTATFDSAEKNNSSGVFASSSSDLITVPHIEVGPISSQNFTLTRLSPTDQDQRNLIGMDLLKDYRCHFLFDKNLALVNADSEVEAGYSFQDLDLDARFHPYVAVDFPTAKASTVWDTGAGITVVNLEFIKQHPAYFQEVGHSTGTDATGASMETPTFIMAASRICGHSFSPYKVVGVDLSFVNSSIEKPMDMILGYSTLNKANWLFDFPGRKWTISKQV